MPALSELQNDFAEAIFSGDGANFSRNLVDGELSPELRVDIYRNNVFGCLSDALKMAYPVIVKLVGDDFFEHIALGFIRQNPSKSGNLHNFGGEMAEFLPHLPEAAKLTYLPDVARLEWACNEVFFSADHPPLNSELLAEVPEDRVGQLKFHLHPATRLISSQYPIHLIWQTNQEDFSGDPAVDLDQGGVAVLVRREAYQVVLQPVTSAEGSFLTSLRVGRDLSSANDAALSVDPRFDVAAALKQFVASSILVDFSL
jgi:hypothetical protein